MLKQYFSDDLFYLYTKTIIDFKKVHYFEIAGNDDLSYSSFMDFYHFKEESSLINEDILLHWEELLG